MDTHGSVVPSQPILAESRINKRRDRSPSETSDGRADTSRGNPSSDRGNPSPVRGNPSSIRGNPSSNNRGNPNRVDFLDSTFTASADHSMSLKDVTQPRSSHQVVYHKGHPTSNAILLYHDTKREVVQQFIANLMSQFHDHYEHVEVIADSYKGIFEDKLIVSILTTLLNVCGVRIGRLGRDIPSSSIWSSYTLKSQMSPTRLFLRWSKFSNSSSIWMTSVLTLDSYQYFVKSSIITTLAHQTRKSRQ